jgi:hypothetical protein
MVRRAIGHQELLEPFELEATFARPLIKLKARYNFVPEIDPGHCALQRHIVVTNETLSQLGSRFPSRRSIFGPKSLTRPKLAGALSHPDRVRAEFLSRLSRVDPARNSA